MAILGSVAGQLTVNGETVGNPPETVAKKFVAFDGVGTLAIKNSYGVTSVTDLGIGQYFINFTVAFPDINYICCASVGWQSGWTVAVGTGWQDDTKTVSGVRLISRYSSYLDCSFDAVFFDA